MLAATRKFAKSPVALVLIGLLVLSFAVFGISDVFNFNYGNAVVKAGDREVSQTEFAAQFERVRANFEQQSGQPVTLEDLTSRDMHLQFLERIATEEGFFAWAWKTGIRPAEELILETIREQRGFFNQVTGAFDQTAYESQLAQVGLTPAQFERSLRDQAAANHYLTGVLAGMRVPRVYGALQAAYAQESRSGSWFVLDAASLGEIEAPTDAQLTAFLNENAEALRRPELRTVTLLRFTPSQIEAPAVSDEAIAERFEFRRESLGQAERRSFATVTFRNADDARQAVTRLRAGEDLGEVAGAFGLEPAIFDSQPRSAIADPAVAATVFGLQANQVSDPVNAELGQVVVVLRSILPGQEATLEAYRDEIRQELQAEAARERVYELVEAYEAARQDGASFEEAATRLNIQPLRFGPITADGRAANGQPIPAPEILFTTAYETDEGDDSGVVDAGQGEYFVLRVDEVAPARLPSVEEVRAPLTNAWMQREVGRRLRARAEELAGRVRGGEDIAAVAASAGVPLVTASGVSRDPEAEDSPGEGVLSGLFGQGRGQVFSNPVSETAFAIGRVDAIRAPSPALAARNAESARPQITMQIFENLQELAQSAAGERVEVESYPDRARAALNLPPEEETPEGEEGAAGDTPPAE